jgi:hypothetical protein
LPTKLQPRRLPASQPPNSYSFLRVVDVDRDIASEVVERLLQAALGCFHPA